MLLMCGRASTTWYVIRQHSQIGSTCIELQISSYECIVMLSLSLLASLYTHYVVVCFAIQAGEEARRGSFSLTLTVGTPTSFTGSFTENSGATYAVTETKLRSAVPDDIDCFRTDLSLVTGAESFSFTGANTFIHSFSLSLSSLDSSN